MYDHHIEQSIDQPDKVVNPARGAENMNISLSPQRLCYSTGGIIIVIILWVIDTRYTLLECYAMLRLRYTRLFKKNLNASKPSEHPPQVKECLKVIVIRSRCLFLYSKILPVTKMI